MSTCAVKLLTLLRAVFELFVLTVRLLGAEVLFSPDAVLAVVTLVANVLS